jgi:hypothetical protein
MTGMFGNCLLDLCSFEGLDTSREAFKVVYINDEKYES